MDSFRGRPPVIGGPPPRVVPRRFLTATTSNSDEFLFFAFTEVPDTRDMHGALTQKGSSMELAQVSYTPEQRQELLAKLREPFHPDEILWRTTNKARDGKSVCVAPYADRRAYSDRLNVLFSPSGWSEDFNTTMLAPVPRKKNNAVIITGKVMVSCRVVIEGLGSHSSTGEEWADDENAMTKTEAQSFKRACTDFGLGRYLYDVPPIRVKVDQHGNFLQKPELPVQFLPKKFQQATVQQRATQQSTQQRLAANSNPPNTPNGPHNAPPGPNGGGRPLPPRSAPAINAAATNTGVRSATCGSPRPAAAPGTQPALVQSAPLQPQASGDNQALSWITNTDPKKRAQIRTYASILGGPLFDDIVNGVTLAVQEGTNKNDLGTAILEYLERAARGMDMVRSLGEQLAEEKFFGILDALNVERLDAIPTFGTLTDLVKSLQAAVPPPRQAAAA